MSSRTSVLAREKNPQLASGELGPHVAVRRVDGQNLRSPAAGFAHDLSRVPAYGGPSVDGAQQTLPCGFSPRTCPFGGVCHTCPLAVQTKLAINQPGDEYEREADRVAEQVMRMPAAEEEEERCRLPGCARTVQRKAVGGSTPVTLPPIVSDVLHRPGWPLDVQTRAKMEPRFGYEFSQVRIHTGHRANNSAHAIDAQAYTVGRDIFFGAGRYTPGTATGDTLLAHELTHVIQQGWAPAVSAVDTIGVSGVTSPRVQRASAADPRLPHDQPEAIAFATASKASIDAANIRLSAAADPGSRNVPGLIAQRGITLAALTPRHDSAVGAPQINFFAGQVDYADSVLLPERATHHIDAARTSVRIRAREHGNIDNLLPGPNVEERLVQAISEIAFTAAARSGAPNQLDLYRAQFNSLWNAVPFTFLTTDFDPALDSKGPRTTRARAIFERIYTDNPALKAAYDANTGGIRDRIDTYTGPEGLNPLNSPRLQTLRAAFFPVPAPVPNASYAAFRASIQAAANPLDQQDRDVVDNSNEWQLLINQHVTTPAKRAEIRTIIRTPPPAAPAPPAVAPPGGPVAPAPAPGGVTPQMFVDAVRIDGPGAPVVANGRKEQVSLTPRSTHANPAVPIDTRLTVTPAGRVDGSNVSPTSRWPDASATGAAFEPEIINSATVVMNAHLDLVNGPVGLAPANPIPDLPFTVQDNRQAQFIANWFAAVNFNSGAAQEWFVPGTSVVSYRGGTQNFGVGAFLPAAASPNTNPGLSLFVKARIKRGAATVAAPATLEPFPPDQSRITEISINIPAPALVPVAGDRLDFEVELIAADRTTVLNSKIITIPVMPESVYTRAQAIAAAVADDAHLHDTTAAGLLGKMTAAGGVAANVAAAVKPLPPAVPPPGPLITLKPLTVRHDSAAYVAATTGGPDPSQVGYFVGTTYNNAAPDAAHSFAGVAGAAAFHLPSGFGPRFVVANRTTDVAAGTTRADPSLIRLIVHEAVHAMDFTSASASSLERYKKEFRAYWTDGRFGPPGSAACPVAPGNCKEATTDPSRPPPGPKSPRANAIFELLYGSTTYPFVKPAYDNNTGGFRIAVDDYVIPDGINLIVSVRLESLRQFIRGITNANFAARRVTVQGFVGVGAPPAVGALTVDEKNEIQRNRAWRDLVNVEITNAANRALIKADLGIPT